MPNARVAVTGLGVISPVGNTKDEFWKSLVEGKSGTGRLTKFDPANFTSQVSAEVKNFNPQEFISAKDTKRMAHFVQFAVAASKMAISDAGLKLESEKSERIGVLIGSGIGGLDVMEEEHSSFLKKGPSKISPFMIPMLIVNMASGQVAINLGLRGPNSCVATACASGSHAIGDAFKIVQRREADIMVAGGTESCITYLGFGGFCALKALTTNKNDDPEHASRPFDKERDGFVMGEGAGVIVLEELGHAKARGANIYCEMIGYGMSADAFHMTAPDPEGEGAAASMRAALLDAHIKPEEVTYINAHGTGTPLNDKVETLAIKKVFGEYAKKVAVSSTKSMTGHLLGAAGGIESVACSLAIKNDIIPPTINYEHPDPECDLDYVPNKPRKTVVDVALSNSLGFGGHNATLVFKKFRG